MLISLRDRVSAAQEAIMLSLEKEMFTLQMSEREGEREGEIEREGSGGE